MEYRTLDPATGRLIRRFPFASEAEIERALAAAAVAARGWKVAPLEERTALLERVAELLESRSETLAERMAVEMGKPLDQGRAEVSKCAAGCRSYAAKAAEYLAPTPRTAADGRVRVQREALGPLLAIMPWNYPFWQFFRFAAPALAAGNTVVLKHAPGTPGCALDILDLHDDAGAPAGVVQSLFLSNEQAARAIADRRIRGVTLTGSTAAGREVAALAGRHLKTMVLELGGCDPFVVFDDCDVAAAARTAVLARCQNSGQSCIAAKRFLVQRGVYDVFVAGVVSSMEALRCGPPREAGVDLGPLAREDLRDRLAAQVEGTLAAGAAARCGGRPAGGDGFFYPPTLLEQVPPDSPAAVEELFGPVAGVFPFDDEGQAVEMANATAYGLGASVWTGDAVRGERMARRLEAGNVFVNGMVRSDAEWPFGGVKDSGFGRELSWEGIVEFVNTKTVWTGE